MIIYISMFLYNLDLMDKMLCIDEDQRLNIDQVMTHSFIRKYFEQNEYKEKVDQPVISESNTFDCRIGEYLAVIEEGQV